MKDDRLHEESDTIEKTTSGANEEVEDSAARLTDPKIKDLSDWREEMLARVRAHIKAADPDVAVMPHGAVL